MSVEGLEGLDQVIASLSRFLDDDGPLADELATLVAELYGYMYDIVPVQTGLLQSSLYEEIELFGGTEMYGAVVTDLYYAPYVLAMGGWRDFVGRTVEEAAPDALEAAAARLAEWFALAVR